MEKLREKAAALLANNRRSAILNGKTYTYTVPSPKTYPFQWFWDSCFHAIVYTALGQADRAKEELRSLLTAQREDGFIPHIVFWDKSKVKRWPWCPHYLESEGAWSFLPFTKKPRTSELMQPPLLAEAVAAVADATHDQAWLKNIVPQLNAYYRCLISARDPDKDGLISIVAPFESGLDFSPAYDPALGFTSPPSRVQLALKARLVTFENKLRFGNDARKVLAKNRFQVEDVLVNSIFALNLLVLAELNAHAGMPKAYWQDAAQRTTNALVAKCYDQKRKAFFNLSGRDEQRFPVLAIHSLMPLIIPILPEGIARELIETHVKNPDEFLTPFPFPTVAKNEPSFSAAAPLLLKQDFIWRGSTWVNINWYLVHALRRLGEKELAETIVARTKELVARHGFREYFNPLNGKPEGAESFGWSTLIVDM